MKVREGSRAGLQLAGVGHERWRRKQRASYSLLLRTVFRNLKQWSSYVTSFPLSFLPFFLSCFSCFLPLFLPPFLPPISPSHMVVAETMITLDTRTLLFRIFFGKPYLMDGQRYRRVCMCVRVRTRSEVDLLSLDPRDCLDFLFALVGFVSS